MSNYIVYYSYLGWTEVDASFFSLCVCFWNQWLVLYHSYQKEENAVYLRVFPFIFFIKKKYEAVDWAAQGLEAEQPS